MGAAARAALRDYVFPCRFGVARIGGALPSRSMATLGGAAGAPQQAAPAARAAPGLVSASGAPITSTRSGAGSGTDPATGAEVDLTPQNASQILQSPGALLLQVGNPTDAVSKKLTKLRKAANGQLPLVRLDCSRLPQICQALQIKSQPAVLLMARGQVAAALENDLSPQTVTAFVEGVANALRLKVDLSEGVTEQLAEGSAHRCATPGCRWQRPLRPAFGQGGGRKRNSAPTRGRRTWTCSRGEASCSHDQTSCWTQHTNSGSAQGSRGNNSGGRPCYQGLRLGALLVRPRDRSYSCWH